MVDLSVTCMKSKKGSFWIPLFAFQIVYFSYESMEQRDQLIGITLKFQLNAVKNLVITWIGHATVLIQVAGINI